MRKIDTRLLAGAAVAAAVAAGSPAHALNIQLRDTVVGGMNANALNGFQIAANYWQSVLTNNVTVNFDIGFSTTGFSSPNVIGGTTPTRFTGVLVSDVYSQLAATGNSQLDAIAVANLSALTTVGVPLSLQTQGFPATTGALSMITQQAKPNGTGVVQNGRTAITSSGIELTSNREYDTDGSRNNFDMLVNTSVLKALGYGLVDSNYSAMNRDPQGHGIDAKISFNSAFAFDLDPTDGIGLGQTDFISVAIHEFGHALGFVSGVDLYDGLTNFGGNLDTLQGLGSTLDLFRYSDDVTNLVAGSGQVLDWSVGNSAIAGNNLFGRPYFSFDGANKGLSAYGGNAGYFSTGAANGDGQQASHWMDTPYVALPGNGPGTPCGAPTATPRGIMDPTIVGCEQGAVTALDLAAFDAMGWNLSVDVLANANYRMTSGAIFASLSAAPEPGVWAELILGFAGLGAMTRRARRRLVRVRA